jgi:23S rRNA (uracil1939-C5)-methyltransferase
MASHSVEITSVAHGGHGVARIDGRVCFVPYALPGDVATIRIDRELRGVLWGAIESIETPSPDRVDAPCPYFGECGGCTWLHFAYPAQADAKQQIVRDCFERIAKLDAEVEWLENPDLRLGYRTRAKFFAADGKRGFHAQRTHDVVDIAHCALCHPKLNQALNALREIGRNRDVEICVNPEGNDVLVWTEKRDRLLEEHFPLAGFRHSNEKRGKFLFDGAPVVNGCFSQASLLLNRMLRDAVHDAIGSPATLLDLYAGAGNFSVTLPASVKVMGIDQERAPIAAANELRPDSYRAGKTPAFERALERGTWDVILLDPPRAGAKPIAKALAAAKPERIVYVSCNPSTLARDAATICAGGWRIERLQAVDMYPNTAHIECVCTFRRT